MLPCSQVVQRLDLNGEPHVTPDGKVLVVMDPGSRGAAGKLHTLRINGADQGADNAAARDVDGLAGMSMIDFAVKGDDHRAAVSSLTLNEVRGAAGLGRLSCAAHPAAACLVLM